MMALSLTELSDDLYHTRKELRHVVNFLVDIHLQVTQRLTNYYPNIAFPANSEIIDNIKSQSYLYEIMDYFSEQFKRYIKEIGNFTSEGILDDVIHYIKLNFRENLRLETIAPIFGYNSSYLGKLFSLKMGENFNSYLDRVRVEKSKQLLADEKLKVYEIAEQVGYKNVDYFHKKFKLNTGESPVEYRKRMTV